VARRVLQEAGPYLAAFEAIVAMLRPAWNGLRSERKQACNACAPDSGSEAGLQ
jgi:hypothetical protein